MKRKVVDAILSLSEHRRFTKGIFAFVGFKTKWFPHENAARAAGDTKWNYKKLLSYAADGIFAYSDLPLKLPLYGGLALLVLSVLFALVLLIVRLCGVLVPGTLGVLFAVLFLAGWIFLSIGILGAYLARVYGESKNRPHYIVSETNLPEGQKR